MMSSLLDQIFGLSNSCMHGNKAIHLLLGSFYVYSLIYWLQRLVLRAGQFIGWDQCEFRSLSLLLIQECFKNFQIQC